MKSNVPCFLTIFSCLIAAPGFAGSTGGSGPPLKISVTEFNSIVQSPTRIVDDEMLTGKTEASNHSYWIEDGDHPGEWILRDRRNWARQTEDRSDLRVVTSDLMID